jgi:molecular chaperone DnaK (HSP70)
VDEHDFKSSLTRQAFEEACAQEIPKFTQPIVDALKNAKMSMVCKLFFLFLKLV